jgi:hypothetical protein
MRHISILVELDLAGNRGVLTQGARKTRWRGGACCHANDMVVLAENSVSARTLLACVRILYQAHLKHVFWFTHATTSR